MYGDRKGMSVTKRVREQAMIALQEMAVFNGTMFNMVLISVPKNQICY